MGDYCLVFKSDPITFATDEIGWYVVQVNANDIATTGATPRWFLLTALLPEKDTKTRLVDEITEQVIDACNSLGISLIGGHTEITQGISRPILTGTMIGEVAKEDLIWPKGAAPGDRILLTKGVPIEGTAVLARELPEQLRGKISGLEIEEAQSYLFRPGISVVRDARVAAKAGKVTAMHDPTEGGLAAALWELSQACGHTLVVNLERVRIPDVAEKVCNAFMINPMETIASGALLMTAIPDSVDPICKALEREGIDCMMIGSVEAGPPRVLRTTNKHLVRLPRPKRDEIARIFDQ
jgi:hydrogenase maturation factor